jgi:hypothetical protein
MLKANSEVHSLTETGLKFGRHLVFIIDERDDGELLIFAPTTGFGLAREDCLECNEARQIVVTHHQSEHEFKRNV